jgi:ATP-dependent protease HslVU (ClpYQ) peptidase subunit
MNHDKDLIKDDKTFVKDDITPKDLLRFAQGILIVISFIFILSGISEIFSPNNNIFEICKTILPQLAMLIMGFYFGKTK